MIQKDGNEIFKHVSEEKLKLRKSRINREILIQRKRKIFESEFVRYFSSESEEDLNVNEIIPLLKNTEAGVLTFEMMTQKDVVSKLIDFLVKMKKNDEMLEKILEIIEFVCKISNTEKCKSLFLLVKNAGSVITMLGDEITLRRSSNIDLSVQFIKTITAICTDCELSQIFVVNKIYDKILSLNNNEERIFRAKVDFFSCFTLNDDYIEFNQKNQVQLFHSLKYFYYLGDTNNESVKIIIKGLESLSLSSNKIILQNFIIEDEQNLSIIDVLISIANEENIKELVRIFGNLLVIDSSTLIFRLIDNYDILTFLMMHLLSTKDITLKTDITWALSNVAAEENFFPFLFSKGIFQKLIEEGTQFQDKDYTRQILFLFQNVADCLTDANIYSLVEIPIITYIISLMNKFSNAPLIVLNSLILLHTLISKSDVFFELFTVKGGEECISKIYYATKNEDIKDLCENILKKYK